MTIEPGPQFIQRREDYDRYREAIIGARVGTHFGDGVGVVHLSAEDPVFTVHPALDSGSVFDHRTPRSPQFHAARDRQMYPEGGKGQGTLFHVDRGRPWTVETMSVRDGYSHLVPSLLGLAAEYTQNRTRRLPEASDNLSVHSAPIVDKLVGTGVINDPRTVAVEHNHITRGRMAQALIDNEAVELDEPGDHHYTPGDVARASNLMRSILRRNRTDKPRPEPEQTRLF